MKKIVLLALMMAFVSCSNPYDDGMKAFKESRWEEAIWNFEKVKMPSHEGRLAQKMIKVAYFHMGENAYKEKNWNKAQDYLKKFDISNKESFDWLPNVKRDTDYYELAKKMLDNIYFFKGVDAFEKKEWEVAHHNLMWVSASNSHYQDAQEMLKKVLPNLKNF